MNGRSRTPWSTPAAASPPGSNRDRPATRHWATRNHTARSRRQHWPSDQPDTAADTPGGSSATRPLSVRLEYGQPARSAITVAASGETPAAALNPRLVLIDQRSDRRPCGQATRGLRAAREGTRMAYVETCVNNDIAGWRPPPRTRDDAGGERDEVTCLSRHESAWPEQVELSRIRASVGCVHRSLGQERRSRHDSEIRPSESGQEGRRIGVVSCDWSLGWRHADRDQFGPRIRIR